jgi:hypothetical protein
MLDRCTNPKSIEWPRYGGRGIAVDPRWVGSYHAFARDMGERPDGLSLDRVDNDGPYSKENCRWSTPAEQQHNSRQARVTPELARAIAAEVDHEPMTVIAARHGVSYHRVNDIKRGRKWGSVTGRPNLDAKPRAPA